MGWLPSFRDSVLTELLTVSRSLLSVVRSLRDLLAVVERTSVWDEPPARQEWSAVQWSGAGFVSFRCVTPLRVKRSPHLQ